MNTTKLQLTTLFIIIATESMGLGIIIPVIPKLFQSLGSVDIADAAVLSGLLLASYGATIFLFAPSVGALGDAYGRRPIFLFSMSLLAIDYLAMALAPTLAIIFITRIISGLAGASFPVVNAYITDISKPQDRAKRFGLIGAGWGLGFTLGPLIGGLLGEISWRAPFFLSAGLIALLLVAVYFFVPESLPREKRRTFSIRRSNPLSALVRASKFPALLAIFIAVFLFQIGHDVNPSIWSFFVLESYQWSPAQIGYSLAAVGISVSIVQATLVGRLVARFGAPATTYIGFSVMSLGYLGFAFASEPWMLYFCIIWFSLGSVAMPALRSLLTECVSASEQGELQGILTSVSSVSIIITPLLVTAIFSRFTAADAPFYFPGAPYILGALCIALCLAVVSSNMKRLLAVPQNI